MLNLKMKGILLDLTGHKIFLSFTHCLDISYCCSMLIVESLNIFMKITSEHAVSQQQNMSHVDWWTLQLQSPRFVLYVETVVSDDDASIVSLTDKLFDGLIQMKINNTINSSLKSFRLILFIPSIKIFSELSIMNSNF